MSRMNGQFTWQTPSSNASLGDDLASTATERIFTATERTTVVEFGVIPADPANEPDAAFSFRALKRCDGSDTVVSAFTSAFAAEGGPAGDPSVFNFDEANKLANGIVTNTAAAVGACQSLRAYCEVTLEKGSQFVLDVVAASEGAATGIFYAKAYPMGAGLVEESDVDSN